MQDRLKGIVTRQAAIKNVKCKMKNYKHIKYFDTKNPLTNPLANGLTDGLTEIVSNPSYLSKTNYNISSPGTFSIDSGDLYDKYFVPIGM